MAAREDVDLQWRATQLAGFEATIKEDRSQESASACNAAVNFLRTGDRVNAASYCDLAARDPQRRPKVEELRRRADSQLHSHPEIVDEVPAIGPAASNA